MPSVRIDIHAPSSDLAGIIAFHQAVDMPRMRVRETLIPAPHYSFIFQFADGFAYRRGAVSRWYPQHLIAAPMTSPVTVHSTGRVNVLRVAMHPHTAGLVLKTAASDLRDKAVDVGAFFDTTGRELVENMTAASDTSSRVAVFERWLRARVADSDSGFLGEMNYAVKRLAEHDGPSRIRDLAAEMSVGERQLERWFLRCVGLGPKVFQRILRVNAVLRAANGSRAVDWAALAAQYRFADQSHLVREFATLAGATPAACVRQAGVLARAFQECALLANDASAFTAGMRQAA